MLNKEFYIGFGKVLYAIALADGEIQEEEMEAIFETVKTELAPLENIHDQFGSDLSWYVLFSFENEEDMEADPEGELAQFEAYLQSEEFVMVPGVGEACQKIAVAIAEAYGGTTPGEQKIITRLTALLEKYK